MLFLYRNYYGIGLNDLEEFAKRYSKSNVSEIRTWANQKLRTLKLSKEPFEFKAVSTEGKEIDLLNLRGKVVLIDFLATWCTVCINRMPAIKKVYEKYKHQGFEVLSVCLNPLAQRETIQKVEDKIGANWPLFIIGGKDMKDEGNLGKKIWKKYGFSSVPQLILLDKNGLMVEYNGVLQSGDFEPIIKRHLSQKEI